MESLFACLEEVDTAAAAAAAEAAAALRRRGVGGAGRGLPRHRLRQEAAGRPFSLSAVGGGLVVLVGSAESLERVPASLRRCFTHEVSCGSRRTNVPAGVLCCAPREARAARRRRMLFFMLVVFSCSVERGP